MMSVGELRLRDLSRLVGSAISSCKVLLENLGITDGVEVGVRLRLLSGQTLLYKC